MSPSNTRVTRARFEETLGPIFGVASEFFTPWEPFETVSRRARLQDTTFGAHRAHDREAVRNGLK